MTCAAYGKPTPSITWSRASGNLASKLSDSNSGYKKYDKIVTVNDTDFIVSVLEICGVSIVDTDEYMCTADNGISGIGVASADAKFFLSVTGAASEPPAVIVRPPSEGATVDYGSTIEAVCVAYGNPIPTISWAKDGCSDMSCAPNANIFNEIVTYGDVSFRKSIFQLCNVSEMNNGMYTCSATNGIGGEGVAAKKFSWPFAVNPKPMSTMSSSTIVVAPTTSCPAMVSTASTSASTAVDPTVGRITSDSSERTYQVVAGIEAAVIIILLVLVLIVIIIAVRSRQSPSKQKADILMPPDPVVAVENPIHQDEDLDEKDTDTMTYADLAKKMEAES